MADDDRLQRGLDMMKRLWGSALDPAGFQQGFARLTAEHLFGDVWTRPGLEVRDRSLVTVAALTVLGRENELRVHLQGALNQGISREAITEIMIHLAHYAGWPIAVGGLRVAGEVFASRDAATS
jgi:4-carboxymuconolactone decarboxylase